MHYYQHHIGDFIRDTAYLTNDQTIAYLHLIWRYYDTEKPLENDPERLAFAVGSDPATVMRLLQHYFVLDANAWHHKRIDAEIEAYRKKSKKAAESANARWNGSDEMQSQCERNATAMRTQAKNGKMDANHKPITNISTTDVVDKGTPAKPARFDPSSIDLTDSVPREAWERWIAYRKERKLKTTEQTAAAQARKLDAWALQGHNPADVIEQSIANGWQGLFELKRGSTSTQRSSPMNNIGVDDETPEGFSDGFH